MSKGIGFFTLLFIVFLVLKLAGIGEVATWSWWWVTAPLWLPSAIVIALWLLLIVMGLFSVIVAAIFGS